MISNPLLSICIPTYNREKYIENILFSISLIDRKFLKLFEVVISDNASKDNTNVIVKRYSKFLPINYFVNKKNLGRAENFYQCVRYSNGQFCWLLGDDDILDHHFFGSFIKYLKQNEKSNFFFVNSKPSDIKKINSISHPFNLSKYYNIFESSKNISNINCNNKILFKNFFNIFNCPDLLSSMFTCVFKRNIFMGELEKKTKISYKLHNEFYCFESTFPHLEIFISAFINKFDSIVVFSNPLTISFSGVREWGFYSPLINLVYLPLALVKIDFNKISIINRYIYLNLFYRNFFVDFVKLCLNKKRFEIKLKTIFFVFLISIFVFLSYTSLAFYIRKKFNDNIKKN